MKTNRKVRWVLTGTVWVFISLTFLASFSYGAIPQKINYQGYLTSAAGIPVNGVVQMVFSIYNVPSGGTELWTETQNVMVTHGVYNVELGDVTPIPLPFDVPYYLGIKVGTDPEMIPRIALTSVGYAFRAQMADNAGTGTITGVTAGTGLTGGGISGNVTLSILPPYLLPQSCGSGQIASWNGSTWVCAVDQNSGGTITGVTAGSGLTGGGTSGNVILSVASITSSMIASPLNLSGSVSGAVISGDNFTTTVGYGLRGSSLGTNGIGVSGYATATGAVNNYGGSFQAEGDYGRGVMGYATGTSGFGVYGYASATAGATNFGGFFDARGDHGIGVFGVTTGASGTGVYGRNLALGNVNNVGGTFQADGDRGWGVAGYAPGASGIGVFGRARATGNVTNYGGSFQADGDVGVGVHGTAAGTSGTGLQGEGSLFGVSGNASATGAVTNYGGSFGAGGNYGIGVLGYAHAAGAVTNYGGTFQADGDYGVGVRGYAAGTSGTGVKGEGFLYGVYGSSSTGYAVYGSTSTGDGVYGSGYNGVYGISPVSNGNGIYGVANNGSSAYAVWGYSSTGYAGVFSGNVQVNGTLSATGTKAFKIDHPLDPANKYLTHYAIESPKVQNMYNGTILLDAYGEAVVQLPDYFEAVNAEEFTYTLTPIGASMPDLYVAEEVQNNQFKISGGVGDKKVSWVLIGQRNDPWVKQNPAKDVIEKPKEEVGTYLYPKGYGQPETVGLEHVLKRQNKP